MNKIIIRTIMMLVISLTISGHALAADANQARIIAQQYVPPQSELTYTHLVDGYIYEVHFSNSSIQYTIQVNSITDDVMEFKMENMRDLGGVYATINEEQIRNMIIKDFPTATIYLLELNNVEGLLQYDVCFSANGLRKGEYKINAATGNLIEKTIKYMELIRYS